MREVQKRQLQFRIYYGGSNGAHRNWRDGAFCLAGPHAASGWVGRL